MAINIMGNTKWLQNAVIYHIFIDRFAGFKHPERPTSPVFIGGNLRGIVDKLPYIKSLGVNAVWVSPFCKGVAYHGYETTNLYKVDERFGTEADVKELIDHVHKFGLKIICDFVPNHVSHKHPYFIDAQHKKTSDYRDWFIFDRWPKKYREFLDVKALPKLNLDHKPAMDHVLGAARKWMGCGFDGLRLDHVIGLSNQNLRDLIEPLREEFPNSVFIGEVWFNKPRLLGLKTIRIPKKYKLWFLWRIGKRDNKLLYDNYIGTLDGVMDFEGAKLLAKYAKAWTSWGRNRAKTKLLGQSKQYGGKLLRASFLDNHDMERFLFRCKGKVEKLKMAAELQFSLKQPVIIYYGTEVGLSQKKRFKSLKRNGDVLCRQPMPWDASKQNAELLGFYKSLITKKLS